LQQQRAPLGTDASRHTVLLNRQGREEMQGTAGLKSLSVLARASNSQDTNSRGTFEQEVEPGNLRAVLAREPAVDESLRDLREETPREQTTLALPRNSVPTQPRGCHPMCTWQCDESQCEETCEPVCDSAKCETRCNTATASLAQACTMRCDKPQCSTVCHPSCQTTDCALCTTTCGKPACTMHCPRAEAQCQRVCSKPRCTWNCRAPKACPQPSCRLKCAHPRDCSPAQTYEAIPPLPSGWVAVESFAPSQSHLQGLNATRRALLEGHHPQGASTSGSHWAPPTVPRWPTMAVPVTSAVEAQQRPAERPRIRRQTVDIPVDLSGLFEKPEESLWPHQGIVAPSRLPWAERQGDLLATARETLDPPESG
jgi:hypothetical protein